MNNSKNHTTVAVGGQWATKPHPLSQCPGIPVSHCHRNASTGGTNETYEQGRTNKTQEEEGTNKIHEQGVGPTKCMNRGRGPTKCTNRGGD